MLSSSFIQKFKGFYFRLPYFTIVRDGKGKKATFSNLCMVFINSFLNIIFFHIILCHQTGLAQAGQTSSIQTDTMLLSSDVENATDISPYCRWVYSADQPMETLAGTSADVFEPFEKARKKFPDFTWFRNKAVSGKFVLENTGDDTIDLLFFIKRSHHLTLFQQTGNSVKQIAVGGFYCAGNKASRPVDRLYLPFQVPPNSTNTYFFQRFGWFPYQNFPPLLCNEQHRDKELAYRVIHFQAYGLCFIIVAWLFVFLGFFTFVQYLWNKDKAYLYYTFFVCMHSLYALDAYDSWPGNNSIIAMWIPYFSTFAATKIQLAHLCYGYFTLHFLRLGEDDNRLTRQIYRFIKITAILLPVMPLAFWLFNQQQYHDSVQTVMFAAVLPFCVPVILAIARRSDVFSRISFISLSLYFVGSTLGFLCTKSWMQGIMPDIIRQAPLLPTIIGVLMESICFFIGLSYRTRLLQIEKLNLIQENIRQLEENTRMRQRTLLEKERLARDLHDDLGSTLSSISILSEAAAHGLPDPLVQQRLSTLGARAREVMDAMSDIVWSINPDNDSMEQMLHRMKEFVVDMLETQGTVLHFEVTATLPALAVPMEKRKDLYLIFKEAINNAAKYSGATEVWVQVRHNNGQLHMDIRDNGQGFDQEHIKPGNGLRNMHQRAGQMGGTCRIISKPGEGTKILAVVPV